MIRAKAHKGEGEDKIDMIILGINKRNMADLLAGGMLTIDGRQLGFNGDIYILGGEDDITLSKDLQNHLQTGSIWQV